MITARSRKSLGALFFFSGLTSLILETVWVRMMVLVFGSTSFAVSTVLTAFMAGLALGSFVAGRLAHRLVRAEQAIALYALLELSVGLCALLLPALTGALPRLHAHLWGAVHSPLAFGLLRSLLALGVLLLPAAAMGATLPALARCCAEEEPAGAPGLRAGRLYAINTAGGVAGVFLAGFVLLPGIGLHRTNLLACCCDLALGLIAVGLWISETRSGRRGPLASTAPTLRPQGTSPERPPLSVAGRVALASIAVSGAVAMVYQVAWTRSLSLVLGSSTYAFSLILAAFLVGLSGGAAHYSRRQTRGGDHLARLATAHLLTALTAGLGVLVLDRLPLLLLVLLRLFGLSPSSLFLAQFLLSALVVFLPAFFMGRVFPAVVCLCARDSRGPGDARATGTVYAANTLGAIVGSFAGGFLLVPLLGLQHTLLGMVLLSMVLAAAIALLGGRNRWRTALLTLPPVVATSALVAWSPWRLELLTAAAFRPSRFEEVFRRERPNTDEGRRELPREAEWREAALRLVPAARAVDTGLELTLAHRVVFHREGVTTTVSLTRTAEDSLSDAACWVRQALLVNGKPDASLSLLMPRPPRGCAALAQGPRGASIALSPSGDSETQILSGLLPFCVAPAGLPPKTALIIGWGSGVSVGAALRSPLERLTVVELEQEVVAAARIFAPENHDPERDPRLTLLADDGRNYLAASDELFDVIVSEPSNPWIAGCGNLFTREFFARVRERLSPRGVFLQWLQAYEIAPENVWSVLGTLVDSFESVHIFRPARAESDLLLVARRSNELFDWTEMARRMAAPWVREELRRIDIEDPSDLLARLIADPRGIRRIAAGAPRNTDDNARLEFAAPKDLVNYRRYSSGAIVETLRGTLPDPLMEVRALPLDSTVRLCHALLRAGRPRDALRLASRSAGPSTASCRATAELLLRPLPPVSIEEVRPILRGHARATEILRALAGPRRAAVQRMASLLSPRSDAYLGLVLLGHLLALEGESFWPLAYLTAADERAAEGRAPPYLPLRELLGKLLYRRHLYAAALTLLARP